MLCDLSRRARLQNLFVIVLILSLLLVTTASAFAKASAQENSARQITLGQYVHAKANAGDQAVFALPVEVAGNYQLLSGDEKQAANFSFSIANSEGEVLTSDAPFVDSEVTLDPGNYTLTFTATASADLSAVVVGDFGTLSVDADQPGALFNGSAIHQEGVTERRYATLTIPETDYFQYLHLLVLGGQDDDYAVQVGNDDILEFGSSSDERESGVQFWTRGGTFDVEISPTGGGESLTVMVLLSGPAKQVQSGVEAQCKVGGDLSACSLAINVEMPGSIVTAFITPDSDSVSYQASVSLNPESNIQNIYVYGEATKMVFMAPYAGQYIFNIMSEDDETDFTLLAEVGGVAPTLPLNGRRWGIVPAGEEAIYQLQVDSSGNFLTLALLGRDEGLDMAALMLDKNGEVVHNMSLFGVQSFAKMISQSNAQSGPYEVRITNQYSDEDSRFVLSSRIEDPLDFTGQWAISATASSEYQADRSSAMQAIGEPNTPFPGDQPTAWASKEADAGEETLTLSYEIAVVPEAVRIYETNAPGAVVKVEAYDSESEEWSTLWQGNDPSDQPSRIFQLELEPVDFVTRQIRLTLDSATIIGWNEIDAVELIGLPQ